MSGGHAHSLFFHATSPVHTLPAHRKIVSWVLVVGAIAATRREAIPVFALHLGILWVVARAAQVEARFLARKLVIEIPFVLFAVFLPLVAQGDRIEVAGIALSAEGLWGAWNVIAKATLALAASALLAATTTIPEILRGLEVLRAPRMLIVIAGSMVRYADVLGGELRRNHIARISRGYDPGWLWQVRPLASSLGNLFVRSYERGERIYSAMVSRGYCGSIPASDAAPAPRADWALALVPALVALAAAAGSWSAP